MFGMFALGFAVGFLFAGGCAYAGWRYVLPKIAAPGK